MGGYGDGGDVFSVVGDGRIDGEGVGRGGWMGRFGMYQLWLLYGGQGSSQP